MIAGVDGFKGRRWVAAIDTGNRETKVALIESFQALLERKEFSLVVIDVPIGLLEAGFRECDKAARKLVGARRSSVFPAPIRSMLDATSHHEASQKRYAIEQKKCSIQLYSILRLIREVDEQFTPDLQSRMREGHPEVSFTLMNDDSPMHHTKRTPAGRDERLSLLASRFPDVRQQMSSLSRLRAETDVIDAYALLWSARRVAKGTAKSLPENPQYDPSGLRAEIVA
jgi:predicted RNase H-like nuclease